MPTDFKYLQFQIFDIRNFTNRSDSEDMALNIAGKVHKGEFDFVVIKLPELPCEGDKGIVLNNNCKMIFKILKLTGCPVLSITKWPVSTIFRNILQPIDLSINPVERYEQILPIIKVFNPSIHLLMVNNTPDHEVNESCRELLDISSEYFLRFNIHVKSKIINHLNKLNTILAYASIIGADLIGNGTGLEDFGGADPVDLTWNHLIYRSDIPLFNYNG